MTMRIRLTAILVLTLIAGAATRAHAVPAFARKYHTSCETCHTIFPRLTPFGEAFRRNGYRFPGVDSDFVKAEPVPLGQDAWKKMFPKAVWPGTLPPAVPLAFGFNGSMSVDPNKSPHISADSLIEEAHLWGAGAFDDDATYFAEVTFADGGAEVEHATVEIEDLVGPQHLVNVVFGKGQSTLTSFGPHQTYIDDTLMPLVPVTQLGGAQSDSFDLIDNYAGVELNGTAEGRVDYSLGYSAGPNADPRSSQDLHAHVGCKIGGMRLDGEDSAGEPADPDTEKALTLDAFWVRAKSNVLDAAGASQDDLAIAFGGSARGQLGKFVLDAGAYLQSDSHALTGGGKASTFVDWNELSWRVYPWLAAGTRVDYVRLKPSGTAVEDLRITPGIAALIRPNLKLTLTTPIERAHGAPDGGWSPVGGLAVPVTPTAIRGSKLEAVQLTLWTAF